ncbi:MAG: XkdF-like putative serine protease domain-containing protein [Planctomycetota bacterium]|jgi:uncharacterized protein YdaT
MPWTAADADRHIEGLTAPQKEAWAKIANRALADCDGPREECEGRAIRIANSQAKRVGKVIKVDEAQQLVFGWLYVMKTRDGEQVVDHSTEYIPEVDELEKAMYDYVLESRESNDMHDGPVTGRLVESFVSTPEKLEAMGLPADALPQGVWVGFKLDEESFDKVRRGERTMFSIEGTAVKLEE